MITDRHPIGLVVTLALWLLAVVAGAVALSSCQARADTDPLATAEQAIIDARAERIALGGDLAAERVKREAAEATVARLQAIIDASSPAVPTGALVLDLSKRYQFWDHANQTLITGPLEVQLIERGVHRLAWLNGDPTAPVPKPPEDIPPVVDVPEQPEPDAPPVGEWMVPEPDIVVQTVPRAIAALKDGVRVVKLVGPAKVGGQPMEPGKGQTLIIDGEITGQPNGPSAMIRMKGDGSALIVNGVLDAANEIARIVEVHGDNVRIVGNGTLRNSLHNGISGDKFKNLLVDGLMITNCAEGGGHPGYLTGPADGVEWRNCTFGEWRGSIHMLKIRANDVPGTEIRNVYIHHNTFRDASPHGEPISVDDLELDGPPMVFNVRIENNRYVDKAKGKNIRLRNCVGGVIANNEGVGGFNLDKNKDVEVR